MSGRNDVDLLLTLLLTLPYRCVIRAVSQISIFQVQGIVELIGRSLYYFFKDYGGLRTFSDHSWFLHTTKGSAK